MRHSRKGEADRTCGMETIRMVSGAFVRELMGCRLAEWQLYLRDHRIFGKESRHPCTTVPVTIQYHIVAFNSTSLETIPCFYANSTDMCYSFKELFIGLGRLGKFAMSLNRNSHWICGWGILCACLE